MNVAPPNRHICKVELGEDVGLKAGGQVDFGERSLVCIVVAHGAQSQLSARDSLQKPMVGCLRHPTVMRSAAIVIVADL